MVADTSINHLSADNILQANYLRLKLTDDRVKHINIFMSEPRMWIKIIS